MRRLRKLLSVAIVLMLFMSSMSFSAIAQDAESLSSVAQQLENQPVENTAPTDVSEKEGKSAEESIADKESMIELTEASAAIDKQANLAQANGLDIGGRAAGDPITITVRVFDQKSGASYTIGTDTAYKADRGIQSKPYTIPSISKFKPNATYDRLNHVAGNWYSPSGDRQPGSIVYWSNNSSTATMTY